MTLNTCTLIPAFIIYNAIAFRFIKLYYFNNKYIIIYYITQDNIFYILFPKTWEMGCIAPTSLFY